jgi:hypothetical protein
MKTNSRKTVNNSKSEKVFIPSTLSGLARSHRLIRTEKEKELLFMKLCSQIRLNDFKKMRSENQKDNRRIKRYKYCSAIIR